MVKYTVEYRKINYPKVNSSLAVEASKQGAGGRVGWGVVFSLVAWRAGGRGYAMKFIGNNFNKF